MAEPLVVFLILIGSPSTPDAAPALIPSAVRESLGPESRVVVEHRVTDPPDADARAAGERLGASAVAEIVWLDPDRRRARIHLFLADEARWYEREVGFDPADSPGERERTVGYLVGAMVRGSMRDEEPPPTAPPPIVPLSPGPFAIAPPPAAERPQVPTAPPPRRLTVELILAGSAPLGGEGLGLGPAAAARFFALPWLGVHAGGGVRFGRVADADASLRSLRLPVGASLRPRAGRSGLEVVLDADLLAVQETVERDFPPAARSRWVSGASLSGSLGWRFDTGLVPFVGFGVDALAGRTPVVVAGRRVAELPPWRLGLEAGVRATF